MTKPTYRMTAICLLLSILLSLLPTFAAPQSVRYSTSSNSGERNEICVSLSGTGAQNYYTGKNTYENLSKLSPDALYDALEALLTDTHRHLTSYSDCRDYATVTDCENGDGRVMLIYTSFSATKAMYNTGNTGWNREHVWPKSLGGFNQDGAGADLHHIRPSNQQINSIRGNKLYGEVSGGNSAVCTMDGTQYTGGYSSGNYFEPLDNVKGDVARICLYVYVRWAAEYPRCGNLTNVFQSIDILLEWCAEDPVDTWEMGRNEVVASMQGNRNVFVDYPELAWLLFGKEIPNDMTTPSGKAAEGNPSCKHAHTKLRNASDATCGKDGYTGDTYCTDCGEKLQSGKVIPATQVHSFGEWTTDADGIPYRTCKVCQKVQHVNCIHEHTQLKNVLSPTCKDEGYTGDLYCTDCDMLVQIGNAIPVSDQHSFGEWTTDADGTRHRTCSVCGQEESIPAEPPMTDEPTPEPCPHTHTEYRNRVEASCREGYSGDLYCTDCGALVMEGLPLPAVQAHDYGESIYIEGSDLQKQVCKVCGHEIVDKRPASSTSPEFPTVLLWIAPCAILLIGGTVIGIVVVKKRKA